MVIELNDEEYLSVASLLQGARNNALADKIKNEHEWQKKELGRTTVIWTEQDLINEFFDRFTRSPTDEELTNIKDNYLRELNDVGAVSATEQGWNVIYDAFEDYESDNDVEED